MTTNEIYQQIKNAVMYYPANAKKCLQPQTFRALLNDAHLTAANLGVIPKEKDTPFFYSRAWAANKYNPNAIVYDYPLVVVAPLNRPAQQGIGNDKVFKSDLRVQFGVMDKVAGDCAGCDPQSCEARTSEQVRQDTEQMLINVLYYLSGVNLYELDGVRSYDVEGRVLELQRTGKIREFKLIKKKVLIKNDTFTFSIDPIEPLQGVTGSAVVLNLPISQCEAVDFDFSDVADSGELVYANGCLNCGN